MAQVPGLVISAPSSRAGKTTLTIGLMRALAEDGMAVQAFKSGPDYVDPAFHRAASGRASFNLDSWAMDGPLLDAIMAQASDADICITEGAMGLYDGSATRGQSGFGSTADIATRFGWPVVLVVDVAGQAQSAGAIALGFQAYNPALTLAGVILNRVASARHERLARLGVEQAGIRVLGALPKRPDLELPQRHLGLTQAGEHSDIDATMTTYARFVREHVDLHAITSAAAVTAVIKGYPALPCAPAQRIALADDVAFSFTYPHLLEGWRSSGAQILPFSPLNNEAPARDADLVWLPGGYPELHAGKLAAADTFLAGLRAFAQNRPVHGECGGYMALGQGLIDKDGNHHAMAGLLGLVTSFETRKLHLGYRSAVLAAPIPGHDKGAVLRGHEFHYSTVVEQPDDQLASISDANGNPVHETGSYRGNVSGSFFHMIAAQAHR